MNDFNVCVLTYGDHLPLIQRCLQSLHHGGDPFNHVADFRIGLNAVTPRVKDFCEKWAEQVSKMWDVPVILFEPENNSYKYPTMRRMFNDHRFPLDDYVMWFDDDSYIAQSNDGFWQLCLDWIAPHDMVGQMWHLALQRQQWKWMQTQSWFDTKIGKPPGSKITFCQGAWWMGRSEVLQEADWPIPELRHCGGDSLLGEVARHKKWSLNFISNPPVRINADDNGKHSGAARRGHTESVIGADFVGSPLSTDHQYFTTNVKVYGDQHAIRSRMG